MMDEQHSDLVEGATRLEEQSIRSEPPASPRAMYMNLSALGAGLLLGFLSANSLFSFLGPGISPDVSLPTWSAWLAYVLPLLFFLLSPLVIGGLVPFIVDKRRKHLFASAFGRSLLVWAGAGIYWLVAAIIENHVWVQEARAVCQEVNNHGFCGLYLGVSGLLIYLVYGILLLLSGSACVSLILNVIRKHVSLAS